MKRTLARAVIDTIVFLTAVLGVTLIGRIGRNIMAIVRQITIITIIILLAVDNHVAIWALTNFSVGTF